jgi:oligopeptidase B
MQKLLLYAALCSPIIVTAQIKNNKQIIQMVTPPMAPKKPYVHKAHGDVRHDDYYWLNGYFYKNADSNAVVDYLKAENDYTKDQMKTTEAFQKKLYTEMRSRIVEDDASPPYLKNGYYYYTRNEKGKEYAINCRKKGTLEAAEEILTDQNKMAEGLTYFALGDISISTNNHIMAYSIDKVSRRIYTIYFKNLETGEILKDEIPGTEGDITWANDNKTVFYVQKNETTLLGEKILRHTIGTSYKEDVVVYDEKDQSNYIGISKTLSGKYIMITSQATLQNEQWYIDANNPTSSFTSIAPRMPKVLYNADDVNDQFYIVTNKDAINFKVVTTPIGNSNAALWKEYIAHRPDVYVSGLLTLKDHLVVMERKNALVALRIINMVTNKDVYLPFEEKAYAAGLHVNAEYNTNTLRYYYQSMVTPSSIIDYNLTTGAKTVVKEQKVLGGYNKANYISERLYATATDGTKVPISLVYKKGTMFNGKAPLLLYAYGSYGYAMDASFNRNAISLLDRGFIYAIAHIRGGADMGRQWYEDGKLMKKKNTFTDFIDCADYLIKNKYTSKKTLFAEGGSAGGLLMGAIPNMRPDLWKGIIADVPFVDVVTTMSDANIPLTTNEYDEWGNPANKEAYFYMKSYSPYDNVENKAYPNMLILTGLHDSQVQYFEPAKWVAKLRTQSKYKNMLLLKTDMDAGHGGASGRFKYLEEIALKYAFMFKLLNIKE